MPVALQIDEKLFAYCTPSQLEKLRAVNDNGGARAAALALGCAQSAISAAFSAVKKKAAHAGYSPEHDMTRTVPHGYDVRGVSSYYGKDGELRGQWVKSRANDNEREEALKTAVAALSDDVRRAEPIAPPAATAAHLCNLYTLTDCHVGALAWRREGGEDWDLSIAERTLVGCFAAMIDATPAAGLAVVNQLGDFLHWDGLEAKTPTSGHMLDADGRFQKLVEVAVRVLRKVVDMALARHDRVHVIMAEGNHDLAGSVWLRVLFAALYENEPRVTVEQSPLPYYAFQHGKTMLAFHHGHLRKMDHLDRVFAAQFPAVWGATTKRYAHTGHLHHERVLQELGMKLTQHPTLAARDSYSARAGYISDREATAYTYHEEHGQVASFTVSPDMLG